MTTRRAFLAKAAAVATVATRGPRAAVGAGGPRKAVLISMLPKEATYKDRFQMAVDVAGAR